MAKDTSTKPADDLSEIGELKRKDYERIGRALEAVIVHGYSTRKRLFIMNVWRGLFFGVGSTIGATVVIVVILYTLSFFSEVPLLGDFFETLQQSVEQQTQLETGVSQ